MTPKEYRALIARVEAEQCRRDPHRYFRDVVWPVVEPGTEFVDNFHIHVILEHLKAVVDGEISNLLINIPPRFAKSLLVSVSFPTYTWIDHPESRFIYASYSANLSTRDALKSRRVINSIKYQEYYGDRFALSDDQDVKARYENDKTGFRLSTSVGGLGTGEGGDYLVCDDPHNVLQAESDPVREEAWLWWSETMSSRLNNPKKGGKIVVMQRVHESDVSGHILAEQASEYEHLCIPMRYEVEKKRVMVNGVEMETDEVAEKKVTKIGFSDPRSTEGELLWPQRFDEVATRKLESAMGSYAVAGQMQQRPSPRGGGLFVADNFVVIDKLPEESIVWVRAWDLASTEELAGANPAYTASVLMGKVGHEEKQRFIIADVTRDRLSPDNVRKKIKAIAQQDGRSLRIHLPQDPGQAGVAQAKDLIAMLAGWVVKADRPTGDKHTRAEPLAAQVEAKNVMLLRGPWNQAFISECRGFPTAKYKDQVDAAADAFNELIPMPNSASVLLAHMENKVAALKKDQTQQVINPFDRTQGARNVTDLSGFAGLFTRH